MSSSCRRELQSRTPSLVASPGDFVYAKPNMCVLAAALEKFRARALGFAMRGATAGCCRALSWQPTGDNERASCGRDSVLALHSQ